MKISIEEEKKIKSRLIEIQEGAMSSELSFRMIERACNIAVMNMNMIGLEGDATNGARLVITAGSLQDSKRHATWATMEMVRTEWRSVTIMRSCASRISDGTIFALQFTEQQRKRILEAAESFYEL